MKETVSTPSYIAQVRQQELGKLPTLDQATQISADTLFASTIPLLADINRYNGILGWFEGKKDPPTEQAAVKEEPIGRDYCISNANGYQEAKHYGREFQQGSRVKIDGTTYLVDGGNLRPVDQT